MMPANDPPDVLKLCRLARSGCTKVTTHGDGFRCRDRLVLRGNDLDIERVVTFAAPLHKVTCTIVVADE